MMISNTTLSRSLAVLAIALANAGCSTPLPNLPQGQQAYNALPASSSQGEEGYHIGPLDTIAVTVFQEPDLTAQNIQVDTSGEILLPLIGTVMAGGQTTSQLAQKIAARLGEKFLDNPQVSVLVQSSASQRVTVEGSVEKSGVYQITGHTTLTDALAMAQGPSRVARLNEIVIFRQVNGREEGAIFDLSKIRRGEMPDPEILGRDRIVVGLSNVKAAWRDVLSASPLLGLIHPY